MRRRRAILVLVGGTIGLALLGSAVPQLLQETFSQNSAQTSQQTSSTEPQQPATEPAQAQPGTALEALEKLETKGRAPKTGYERTQFGNGWVKVSGCSTRDIILYRDLENPVLSGACVVVSGTLKDLYTGTAIVFSKERSAEVQIDHVVALSDAWQKGAQNISIDQREKLANDPLNLIAASGKENQTKSDGDAATWLPKNKPFRCMYVARQIAVKQKYTLWVTEAERKAMKDVLQDCPSQVLPI